MDREIHKPFISICIPAYKRPDYLRRLLNSISEQEFKDFEIVLSDDSPDNTVELLISEYGSLNIRYFKNIVALGTPANWNEAIRKAKGEWIKLMHDDDWFSDRSSLGRFAALSKKGGKVIFSGYRNIWDTGEQEQKFIPAGWKNKLIANPLLLLSENVIGPPSVMLIHNSIHIPYDVRMKWRVDIDYYIQLIKSEQSFEYTTELLVNVGISSSQVTNSCINVPDVELPEGYLLLEKNGITSLKNIMVYDAWWRIFRNLKIRSLETFEVYVPGARWPDVILEMIRHQLKIPSLILSFGVFSKLFMSLSYLLNFNRLK